MFITPKLRCEMSTVTKCPDGYKEIGSSATNYAKTVDCTYQGPETCYNLSTTEKVLEALDSMLTYGVIVLPIFYGIHHFMGQNAVLSDTHTD